MNFLKRYIPSLPVRVEQLNIDFNLQGIDMFEKWVLPLRIVDDASSNYQSHPRKNSCKSFIESGSFNDYSGSYTASHESVHLYKWQA